MLWSHLILNRNKKYLAVLSFQVIKAEIRMADGKVAVQMNCQKSLVFRGEECNYKNVYRVQRLMDRLDVVSGLYLMGCTFPNLGSQRGRRMSTRAE